MAARTEFRSEEHTSELKSHVNVVCRLLLEKKKKREHRINPVLYLEYEGINEASRIQKEIVGNAPGFGEPNSELSQTHAHELETKLILSSDVHNWNLAENFIVEKNLSAEEGFEFGYALGV